MAWRDPVSAFVRRARAQRRVGQGAACACGEQRPYALIRGRQPSLCFACDRVAHGRPPYEAHHVFGKRNGCEIVEAPIGDHRADLSVAQYSWPPRTLENPDGSPLLRAAAYLRGAHNTIVYILDSMLWIPTFLEGLDAWLCELRGARWWVGLPIAKYAPNRRRAKHD